jgi:hypothetical protein
LLVIVSTMFCACVMSAGTFRWSLSDAMDRVGDFGVVVMGVTSWFEKNALGREKDVVP